LKFSKKWDENKIYKIKLSTAGKVCEVTEAEYLKLWQNEQQRITIR